MGQLLLIGVDSTRPAVAAMERERRQLPPLSPLPPLPEPLKSLGGRDGPLQTLGRTFFGRPIRRPLIPFLPFIG